jgi:hypothetical protein
VIRKNTRADSFLLKERKVVNRCTGGLLMKQEKDINKKVGVRTHERKIRSLPGRRSSILVPPEGIKSKKASAFRVRKF